MKLILKSHLLLLLVVIGLACQNSEDPMDNTNDMQPNITNHTYTNPIIGLSITFPDDWSMQMNVEVNSYDALLLAEKDTQSDILPGVTIIVEESNTKPPMDALLSGVTDLLPTMLDNVDIVEEKTTLINGNECGEIIYTFSEGNVHFKQKQLYFFNKMFIIVISFNAAKDTYDLFLNDLTFIQDSIELKID